MTQIFPIPAFNDNYIWLYQSESRAWVVDPGDAAPVEARLSREGLQLAGIILTHHHMDHVGGVRALTRDRDIPVYGNKDACIPMITHPLGEGEILTLPGLQLEVIKVPGHTLDHIAYFGTSDQLGPVLFCGDTLFSAGCGRLFEGTAAMMLSSLNKLKALPDNTKVYCAHEYTLANLSFAQAVMPDSNAVTRRISECRDLRNRGIPTLPAELGKEKTYNPFLMTSDHQVVAQATLKLGRAPAEESEVMAAIRQWKDNF